MDCHEAQLLIAPDILGDADLTEVERAEAGEPLASMPRLCRGVSPRQTGDPGHWVSARGAIGATPDSHVGLRLEVEFQNGVLEHILIGDVSERGGAAERRVIDNWHTIDPPMPRAFTELRDLQRRAGLESGELRPLGHTGYAYRWSENNKAIVQRVHQ